jgi:hypothetical protein
VREGERRHLSAMMEIHTYSQPLDTERSVGEERMESERSKFVWPRTNKGYLLGCLDAVSGIWTG